MGVLLVLVEGVAILAAAAAEAMTVFAGVGGICGHGRVRGCGRVTVSGMEGAWE